MAAFGVSPFFRYVDKKFSDENNKEYFASLNMRAYIKRLSQLPIQNVPAIDPLAWTSSPSEVRAGMHASCASACRESLHESGF